jgi:molybdopterin-guanine dinucleotide biosynthesis protein A
MLLVGSASHDAGQTDLVCSIIRKFSPRQPVVAVKVTVAHERPGESRVPGGPEAFRLTEESAGAPGKGTTRMREAGASRVLWLRVRARDLDAGVRALARTLGPGTLAVAESNTLRTALVPDLFLMLWRRDADAIKDTTRQVAAYVDRTVFSDRGSSDLDLDRIEVSAGRWRLNEPPSAIVLAGGRSQRMGRDKRVLAVRGVRLAQRVADLLRPHVREVLISQGDTADLGVRDARVVVDRAPDQGPLMGLACALAESRSDRNLVAACDLPDIPERLVERLLAEGFDHDCVVPVDPAGRLEPLLALYRRRVRADAEQLLTAGRRSPLDIYDRDNTMLVPLQDVGIDRLVNLNTPRDLEDYLARSR